MYDIPSDLIGAYRAAPDTLEKVLEGCSEDVARSTRGGDEGWSVVEVMCHLRDAEERALERTRAMLDENNPPLAGYDQEAWARERNYAADDLWKAFEAFKRFRAQHVAELEALSPDDWERPGQHEEMGRITIMEQTIHMVAHDSMHTAQLARQLGSS